MRQTFINTLIELAEKDENIYLLTGDLGFSVLEPFAQKFPKRFFNCGVAEQNMMGVAAGLALSGKKTYVYSIIPFVILRCLEQIRNDICYQNLDVKIIGVGAGLAYGHLGATHHAIEDIGILRSLPNMTILSPADPIETRELVIKSFQTKNPTYLRLNKTGEKMIYQNIPELEIGKPSILREGKDGLIIATGILVNSGLEIVEKLKGKGYHFQLISLHTLKPIDKDALLKELSRHNLIFTLEEHNIIGGLGSAIAEILAEAGFKGKFKRLALPDQYAAVVGEREYLRKSFDLVEDKILDKILDEL